MKRLILIMILIATLSMACAVNADPDGMTFWLETKTIQAIHDCESCSKYIDWSTVPEIK